MWCRRRVRRGIRHTYPCSSQCLSQSIHPSSHVVCCNHSVIIARLMFNQFEAEYLTQRAKDTVIVAMEYGMRIGIRTHAFERYRFQLPWVKSSHVKLNTAAIVSKKRLSTSLVYTCMWNHIYTDVGLHDKMPRRFINLQPYWIPSCIW